MEGDRGGADAYVAPFRITLTVWPDRDVEVDSGGLVDYLAAAALFRAWQRLEPDVMTAFLADDEDDDEEEDE